MLLIPKSLGLHLPRCLIIIVEGRGNGKCPATRKNERHGRRKMELIKISTTKLKVMLSADDMKKYELDPDGMVDISTRSAFWRIMRVARERCGFDAEGGRVFVKYYPERHGGCEMFVTKLGVSEHIDSGCTSGAARSRYSGNYIVYSFGSLSEVLATCRCLRESKYRGVSRLYIGDSTDRVRYYLILEKESYFASENYGHRCCDTYYHVICEHGSLLCASAVELLGKLG